MRSLALDVAGAPRELTGVARGSYGVGCVVRRTRMYRTQALLRTASQCFGSTRTILPRAWYSSSLQGVEKCGVADVATTRPSALRDAYDVIIVGGGHNGLVCASYLSRQGYDVAVLERRHIVGGAAVTEVRRRDSQTTLSQCS